MKQYFTPIEKIAENSKIGVFKDTIIIQPTDQVLIADRDATVFHGATIEYGLIEQKPHYKICGRQKTYEDVDDSYARLEDALVYYPEHLVKYKQRVFSDGDYVVKGCMIREFDGEIFVNSEQITKLVHHRQCLSSSIEQSDRC
ncbi:MAG: hypothetical protein AB7D29_10530 [Campylobacterales bacterium]